MTDKCVPLCELPEKSRNFAIRYLQALPSQLEFYWYVLKKGYAFMFEDMPCQCRESSDLDTMQYLDETGIDCTLVDQDGRVAMVDVKLAPEKYKNFLFEVYKSEAKKPLQKSWVYNLCRDFNRVNYVVYVRGDFDRQPIDISKSFVENALPILDRYTRNPALLNLPIDIVQDTDVQVEVLPETQDFKEINAQIGNIVKNGTEIGSVKHLKKPERWIQTVDYAHWDKHYAHLHIEWQDGTPIETQCNPDKPLFLQGKKAIQEIVGQGTLQEIESHNGTASHLPPETQAMLYWYNATHGRQWLDLFAKLIGIEDIDTMHFLGIDSPEAFKARKHSFYTECICLYYSITGGTASVPSDRHATCQQTAVGGQKQPTAQPAYVQHALERVAECVRVQGYCTVATARKGLTGAHWKAVQDAIEQSGLYTAPHKPTRQDKLRYRALRNKRILQVYTKAQENTKK